MKQFVVFLSVFFCTGWLINAVCTSENRILKDEFKPDSTIDVFAENSKTTYETSDLEWDGLEESTDPARLYWSGFVRGVGVGLSESTDISSLYGELAVKASFGNRQTFVKADVRFRDGLFLGERKTIVELKEAYTGYHGSFLDVYLGNQIVSWGRADGFNPTNNLHPTDYFFLSPDPDDQKIGNFMLRANIRPFFGSELELVVIPVYKPSVYRYDLFELGEGVRFTDMQLPATTLANGAVAARFNMELPVMGFSVSYFNGFAPFYGFRLQSFTLSNVPDIVYQPDFYRKQTFGADFALPLGSVIVRGEAAWNLTTDFESRMQVPNPDISSVVGVETSFYSITAIAQYIGTYTIDYQPQVLPMLINPQDPSAQFAYANAMAVYESEQYNRKIMHQQEKQNHAVFLSLNRSFSFDVLSLRISGYYNITSEEYMVRPELKWKLNDALSVSTGGNWMKGPEKSVFNYAGKVLGGAYLGMTVYF